MCIRDSISSDDAMKYDVKRIEVKASQNIKLTLHHKGKFDKTIMGHNWVLLKKGTVVRNFANISAIAVKNQYIANEEQVIAHTQLIGAGESTTIRFKAPSTVGVYDYICTFPGHYALMHGQFIVN